MPGCWVPLTSLWAVPSAWSTTQPSLPSCLAGSSSLGLGSDGPSLGLPKARDLGSHPLRAPLWLSRSVAVLMLCHSYDGHMWTHLTPCPAPAPGTELSWVWLVRPVSPGPGTRWARCVFIELFHSFIHERMSLPSVAPCRAGKAWHVGSSEAGRQSQPGLPAPTLLLLTLLPLHPAMPITRAWPSLQGAGASHRGGSHGSGFSQWPGQAGGVWGGLSRPSLAIATGRPQATHWTHRLPSTSLSRWLGGRLWLYNG